MGKRAGSAAVRSGSRSRSGGNEAAEAKKKRAEEEAHGDDDRKLQRAVFPQDWLPSDAKDIHKTIPVSRVVREYGVPRTLFEKWLEQDIKNQKICASLPFTMLMSMTYFFVVINHDNAPAMNAMEDSISFDIMDNANFAWVGPMGNKGMLDVNSMGDFWSWMSLGVLPLLFEQDATYLDAEGGWMEHMADEFPEVTPMNLSSRNISTFGVFLHYNRLVGGIRMSQEQEIQEGCVTLPEMLPAYGVPCVGGTGPYELDPEIWDARSTSDKNRKREAWFYFYESLTCMVNCTGPREISLDAMQDRLLMMEVSGWLDNTTQKVEVAIPFYNAEYGIHTLLHVNFFFSRGGHIWKAIIPMSVFANWFDSAQTVLTDAIFAGSLLWMIFSQGLEVYSLFKTKGAMQVIEEYYDFWNVMEWVSIYCAMAVMVMTGFNIKFLEDLNGAARDVASAFQEESWEEYSNAVQNSYMPELERAVHYNHKFRLVMAAYPCIIVFRLFKVFSAQPRLAVVTKTLETASIDLFHFLVVFCSIFFIYCIAGLVLYGRNVEAFSTMDRTMYTMFLVMLGIFDWEQISVVGRVEAGIWLWTFMIIVSLVLLNMLMAIVLDAYEEVGRQACDAPTLFEELNSARKRKMAEAKGLRVSTAHTLEGLRKAIKDLDIEKRELQDMLDDMQDDGDIKDGKLFNKHARVWEDLPEELSMDRDWTIPMVNPTLLQSHVSNLFAGQAFEMIEAAMLMYYDHLHAEPELWKLKSASENLAFNMKAWKAEVFVSPYDNTTPQLPDTTFDVKMRVQPVLHVLHKSPRLDHEHQGRCAAAPVAEVEQEQSKRFRSESLTRSRTFRSERDLEYISQASNVHSVSSDLNVTAHLHSEDVIIEVGEGKTPSWKAADSGAAVYVAKLDAELALVRQRVAEQLSTVSALQWTITHSRGARGSLEDAIRELQARSKKLVRENRDFRAGSAALVAQRFECDDPMFRDEADLLRRLAAEQRDLRRQVELNKGPHAALLRELSPRLQAMIWPREGPRTSDIYEESGLSI